MRYTFLHLKTPFQDTISSQEVHLYSELGYIPQLNTQAQVFVYCFSKHDIEQSLRLGYTPHICFKDIYDEVLWQIIEQNPNWEVFWFPKIEDINNDPIEFAQFLTQKHQAICISLSPIFNPECAHETARQWIEDIYDVFDNPLIDKDTNLLNETYSEENEYILVDHDIKKQFIILGLMGDEPIEHYSITQSMKGIMRQRACLGCDYQNACIQKGVGMILQQRHYQGCASIQIMKR